MLFKNIYCRVFKLCALNFYCCNFNGGAVPMDSSLELYVNIKGFVYKISD